MVREQLRPSQAVLNRLYRAIRTLETVNQEQVEREQAVLDAVREGCRRMSLRQFSALAGVHYGHLSEALSGQRGPSETTLARLERVLGAASATSTSELDLF